MHFSRPRKHKLQKTTVVSIVSFACFAACVGTAPAWSQTPGIPQIQLGQAINGTLVSNTELRLDNGTYFQAYEFQGRAGQRLTARMESTAVDSFLAVLGPGDFAQSNDDSGGTLNSTLDFVLPSNGTYTLVASSAIAGQTGSFQISLATTGSPAPRVAAQAARPPPSPSPPASSRPAQPVSPPAAPAGRSASAPPAARSAQASPPPAQSRQTNGGMISVGQTVDGALTTGDRRLDNGNYVDIWNFTGQAGQRLAITMTSTQIAAQIIMLGDNNFAEGSGAIPFGTRNATLNVTLPSTGAYRIAATTQASDETGSYQLSVAAQPPSVQPGRPAQVSPPPAPAGQSASAPQLPLPPLRPGQPVNGTLAATDVRLDNGSYARFYEINAQAGQTYTIRLESTALDSRLMVIGGTGFNLVNDNATQGTQNSMLEVSVPQSGPYYVVASTAVAGQTGPFRLTMTPGRSNAAQPSPPAPSAGQTRTIQLGQMVDGTLTSSDPKLNDGSHVQLYTFAGQVGQRVMIIMDSTVVDPFLVVTGPNNYSQSNNDITPGVRSAGLELTLPATGSYTIAANTAVANQTGAYQLSLLASPDGASTVQPPARQTTSPPPGPTRQQPAQQPRLASGGAIRVGETVTGTLHTTDPVLTDGSHVHRYELEGRAGQQISISLDSTAFDSVLLVTGPNNFQQVNDDASTTTLNSRLDLTLPANGTYSIAANTVGRGQTGAYRLSVSGGSGSQGAAASPPPPSPPPARQQPAQQAPFNASRDCPPMPAGANPNTQGRRLASGGPLSFDEPVCGRLQQGDQALSDGTFADLYTINLQADGGTYQAILVSEGFEPITLVLAPNSDASGVELMPIASGRNLNTVITPRVSGAFTIAVNSAQPGSGRYRLRVVRTRD